MTDETTELPKGWRPEWKPPGTRKKALTEAKRSKAAADADTFARGEVIMPKGLARKQGIKMRPLDDALKAEIVQRVASGELFSRVLAAPEMPSRWRIYDAMAVDEQFAADMAKARKIAADVMADEIIEISDEAAADIRADGTVNYEVIARSKLKTDNRKWIIERIDPARWGSKGQIDVTSGGEKIEAKETSPLESARQVAFAIELAKRSNPEGENTP